MKYTNNDFCIAVEKSCCTREVLTKLGLKASGNNYAIAKNRIKKMGLDISHWDNTKNRKNFFKPKKPLIEILIENSNYQSNMLRQRLIKEGLFEHKCSNCNNTQWLGNLIPLELDHINGINTDHRLENLRLLCPNCHALTDNYRGKNARIKKRNFCEKCKTELSRDNKSGYCIKCIKKNKKLRTKRHYFRKSFICIKCGKPRHGYSKSKLCRDCYNLTKNRKVIDRPSKEQLLKDIEESNYCAVGRKYGVSDNAIRKWLKFISPEKWKIF